MIAPLPRELDNVLDELEGCQGCVYLSEYLEDGLVHIDKLKTLGLVAIAVVLTP